MVLYSRGPNQEHSGAVNASATSQLFRPSKTFPLADYNILLGAARGKHSVLEFGPGYSTWALIEAGCGRILSYEENSDWAEEKRKEFKDYAQVEIRTYLNGYPKLNIELGEFDLAFVDAPTMVERPIVTQPPIPLRVPNGLHRLNACLAALERAPVVYCHDAFAPAFRGTLGHLSGLGYKVSYCRNCSQIGMARVEHAA